jgi:hypothetical protein
MNTSYLVGMLLVLWVAGVLGAMYFSMVRATVGLTQLHVFRIRIAVATGGLVSILALYLNKMLFS